MGAASEDPSKALTSPGVGVGPCRALAEASQERARVCKGGQKWNIADATEGRDLLDNRGMGCDRCHTGSET